MKKTKFHPFRAKKNDNRDLENEQIQREYSLQIGKFNDLSDRLIQK
jgi:hypothetical protein